MKQISIKLFWTIAFAIPFFLLIQISSCTDNTDSNTNVTCTGCSGSTPWSKPGTGKCYATQAECEADLGSGCVLCD